MNRKRFVLLNSVIVAVLLLAACGGGALASDAAALALAVSTAVSVMGKSACWCGVWRRGSGRGCAGGICHRCVEWAASSCLAQERKRTLGCDCAGERRGNRINTAWIWALVVYS